MKFSISKTFRAAKIKLNVVNIKLSIGVFAIHNIRIQHNFSKKQFKGKFCFNEKTIE